MVIYSSFNNDKLVQLIKDGGIGVIPTDTIYGLVCSAFDQEAVEKVYEIKGRDPEKPLIILISSVKDLARFSISPNPSKKGFLSSNWPGEVSIVLPSLDQKFDYLSRGHRSLTFRLPADNKLISLLQKTGPLVAPSANPQGLAPAEDLEEAMHYFIGQVDFGVDGGTIEGSASTLVDLSGEIPTVLRQGEVKVEI